MVDVVLPTRSGVEIRRRCITETTDHQVSQLGGEAAFFEDIFAYSFSISHKKLSNPAW